VSQIGIYDPLSDDPQLGIQSIVLNSSDETLFVAGTTGHVVILQFVDDERRREIEACNCFAMLSSVREEIGTSYLVL